MGLDGDLPGRAELGLPGSFGNDAGFGGRRLLQQQAKLLLHLPQRREILVDPRAVGGPDGAHEGVALILDRTQHALAQHDRRIRLELGRVGILELGPKMRLYRLTGSTSLGLTVEPARML